MNELTRTYPAFEPARPDDDRAIRAIGFGRSTIGGIDLVEEREPQPRVAAGALGPIAHQTIVARRDDGGVAAFATRAVRSMWIGGQPTRVGVLSGPHVDRDESVDEETCRGMFTALRALHEQDGTTHLYLMRLAPGGPAARSILSLRGDGMPAVRPIGRFVTLLMRVRRSGDLIGSPAVDARKRIWQIGGRLIPGTGSDAREIAGLLQRCLRPHPFAPEWTADLLESAHTAPGLAPDDFVLATMGGRLLGCAAVWDQHAFRQWAIDRYTPRLALARPMLNAWSTLLRRPRLPPAGQWLPVAFVSHLATIPDADPRVVLSLVESLHTLAEEREIDWLAIGFAADDPHLPVIREAFGGRERVEDLCLVHWRDGDALAAAIDGRMLRPELALW